MWGDKDHDAYLLYLAPNFVDHSSRSPRGAAPAEFLRAVGGLIQAFPDMKHTVEDVFGEGDRVVTRWSMVGTHTGGAMGQPTGRRVVFHGMSIVRLDAKGRIAEQWSFTDDLQVMAQLAGRATLA
jgi:predicted ester cyclase